MLSTKDLNDLNQIFLIIQQYNLTGINIMDALTLYERSCKRIKIKKILECVHRDINNGMKLPDAFGKHPAFFPQYIVEMMRVNEGTGQSDAIYDDIVKSLDQELDLRRNVGSLLGQLVFLGILLIITIGVMLFVALPSMGKMMLSLDMQIPFYTQILIKIGMAFTDYWWVLCLLIAGFIGSIILFKRHAPDKFAILLLRFPLYGEIEFYQLQYRFAMVFGLCKDAGLDTVKALRFTASASDNVLMADLLERSIKNLLRVGDSLTVTLQRADMYHVLDESYFMILSAGEKSDMAVLMKMRSDFYRKQLIVTAQMFSVKLNNLVLTPTFVLFGVIIISVMAPMFQMMFNMSSGGFMGL